MDSNTLYSIDGPYVKQLILKDVNLNWKTELHELYCTCTVHSVYKWITQILFYFIFLVRKVKE